MIRICFLEDRPYKTTPTASKFGDPLEENLPLKKATISYAVGFNRNQVFKI